MAKSGRSARAKGHSYELKIRDFFRSLGYDQCVSSRSESKSADDKGVDLCFTGPFNVQCKAVEKLGNLHSVLADMPDDGKMNVVVHKRNHMGTVVAMELSTFEKILKPFIDHERQQEQQCRRSLEKDREDQERRS